MKFLNKIFHIFPLLLIYVIFIFPLQKPGLIVGGDWNFPITNQQLHNFGDEGFWLWTNREIITGSQVSHQNIYLLQTLGKLWALLGFDGVSFQKATLFIFLLGIYFLSFKLFFYLTKNKVASSIGALNYLFSPVVFNYLNMGWNYVLLFLALAPLFTLLTIRYFQKYNLKILVALGFISSVAFFQSQSIVWLPLIFFIIYISGLSQPLMVRHTFKLFFGLTVIQIITFLVHLPWIIPILLKINYSFSNTSSYDLQRFSAVISIINSFRQWGSLFNQQFEIAFPKSLSIFSYLPIILVIYGILSNYNRRIKSFFKISLGLILLTPVIYIFRDSVASFAFSSVIRDGSRFLVISSLGISMGVALALSRIRKPKLFVVLLLGLLLSSYPFFGNKLYFIDPNPISSANTYKDFRIRLLDYFEADTEKLLEPYMDQNNLLMPVGGYVYSTTDERFDRSYWGIADTQSRYSSYSSNLYVTDKSNPLITNFAEKYFELSVNTSDLFRYASVYGIDNILYRTGLKSTVNYQIQNPSESSLCISEVPRNDWSITNICPIYDAYLVVYSSVNPVISTDSIISIVKKRPAGDRLAAIGCPTNTGLSGVTCDLDKSIVYADHAPEISIKKINKTKYKINILKTSGNFIMVFNQTYHPGWILKNKEGKDLNYQHLLINQLVNGWLITPTAGESEMEVTVEFYPQTIYSRLLPWSLGFFVFLSVYLLSGLILKKRK